MKKSLTLDSLEPDAKDLFEAAGYSTKDSLKRQSMSVICDSVIKANNVLEIIDHELTRDEIRGWLSSFEGIVDDVSVETHVDSELLIDKKELLAATYAIPLSEDFIEHKEINVDDLPNGKVKFASEAVAREYIANGGHNELVSDGELLRINSVKPTAPDKKNELDPFTEISQVDKLLGEIEESDFDVNALADLAKPKLSTFENKTIENPKSIDRGKIQSMDSFRNEGSRIKPLERNDFDITRTTLESTNAGVDPSSRRYVRGVLHSRARAFKFGVFSYFLFLLCFISGLALTPLVLWDKEKFWWAIYAPGLVLLSLLIYFMFTGNAKCPVCTQRQFALKRCNKNTKAHYSKIWGYMLPTALHAFFFKWFRCIYCGTSLRLKE